MRFEDIYCKIGVKFLNKNKLSDKTYYYLISKDWINNKRETALKGEINHFCEPCAFFKIINEKGYDYKGAEVVIVDVVRTFGLEDTLGLIVIKDLFYTKTDGSFSDLKYHCYTFNLKDFYREEVNLLAKENFNIYNSTSTEKAKGICNCGINSCVDALSTASTSAATASVALKDLEKAYNSSTTSINSPCIDSTFDIITINADDILCNGSSLNNKIDTMQKEIDKLKIKESEENKMFNFNHLKEKFQFGLYKNARMSPYGIAFTSDGKEWTAFDENRSLIDVTGMVFDFECVYAMPVAADAIKSNDVILHNKKPVIVTIHDNEMITCVDITTHEVVNVLPTRSPFGFNFYTKLVSFMEGFDMKPTNDNPFGNIWPFLLMEKNGNNKDMMMAMMLMNQQNNQFNPMMMYLMMEDNKNDSLPYLFMMGQNMMQNYNSGKHECKCGRDIATEKKMSRYAKEEER